MDGEGEPGSSREVKDNKETPLQPMDFGTVARNGFAYLGQNFGQLFSIYLLFGTLWVCVQTFVLVPLNFYSYYANIQNELSNLLNQFYNSETIDETLVSTMYGKVTTIFFLMFVEKFCQSFFENLALIFGIVVAYNSYRGKGKSLGENLREVGGHIGPVLAVTTIMTFLTSLGITFVILPGVIFIGFLILSYPTCGVEKTGTVDSLKQGYMYSRGNFLKIIGVALLIFLVKTIFVWIFSYLVGLFLTPDQTWYNPSTRNYGLIFFSNFLIMALTSLVHPIYATMYACLYVDIRARYEQRGGGFSAGPVFTQTELPDFSRGPVATTPRVGSRHVEGLYCPYCGHLVKGDVCDNCGQKLPFKRR
ncbi:MAG: YciC family protein [Promethearchaeota archaeon]